jgi:hypothetical protein
MPKADLVSAENYQQNINGVIFSCDSVSVLRFRHGNTPDNFKRFVRQFTMVRIRAWQRIFLSVLVYSKTTFS